MLTNSGCIAYTKEKTMHFQKTNKTHYGLPIILVYGNLFAIAGNVEQAIKAAQSVVGGNFTSHIERGQTLATYDQVEIYCFWHEDYGFIPIQLTHEQMDIYRTDLELGVSFQNFVWEFFPQTRQVYLYQLSPGAKIIVLS